MPESMASDFMYMDHWKSASLAPRDGTLQLLKLVFTMLCNNILRSDVEVAQKIMGWLKTNGSLKMLERLLLLKGPATESLAEKLFRSAIELGDVQIVRVLIRAGVNPQDRHCRFGRTALQRACYLGNIEMARELIQAGAEVNAVTTSEIRSPAKIAVDGGDVELLSFLLTAGADVNDADLLCSSARDADFKMIKTLLDAGVDADTKDDPLMSAVTYVDECPIEDVLESVKVLLEAGANVETVFEDPCGPKTVLGSAAESGNIELVELLLRFNPGATICEYAICGAVMSNDINFVRYLLNAKGCVRPLLSCGTPALAEAAEYGNVEVIKLLLEAGADVNFHKSRGDRSTITPLEAASARGDVDLACTLLNAGAKVILERDSQLRSPALEAAVKARHVGLVELLLGADAVVSDGRALLCAVETGNALLVQILLDAGANVDPLPLVARYDERTEWYYERTALQAAAKCPHPAIFQLILGAGANVDAAAPSGEGETVLTSVIQKGDIERMELLLMAGADINNPSARMKGKSALEAAVRNADLPLVQYLLNVGAEPNDPQALLAAVEQRVDIELVLALLSARSRARGLCGRRYGCTALQRAIRNEDYQMVQILLKNGIDINTAATQDFGQRSGDIHYGQTALGTAILDRNRKYLQMVPILLEAGGDPNSVVTQQPKRTALLAAIEIKHLATVRLLIDAGANINRPANNGLRLTAVQAAAANEGFDILRLLLDFGADVNAPAIRPLQRTALQTAAEKGNFALAEELLKAGADVNAPPATDGGVTALQACVIGGFVGLACKLINEGAEVNALSSRRNGRTALEGAAEYGRIDMLQMLIDAGASLESFGETQYTRAMRLASENGHHAARRLLESCGSRLSPNPNTEMPDVLVSSTWADPCGGASSPATMFHPSIGTDPGLIDTIEIGSSENFGHGLSTLPNHEETNIREYEASV